MAFFTKRPVTIEAKQFILEDYKIEKLLDFCNSESEVASFNESKSCLYVKTLEGTMTANPTDWIIKGVHGEFYPCKDAIFKKTYKKLKIS